MSLSWISWTRNRSFRCVYSPSVSPVGSENCQYLIKKNFGGMKPHILLLICFIQRIIRKSFEGMCLRRNRSFSFWRPQHIFLFLSLCSAHLLALFVLPGNNWFRFLLMNSDGKKKTAWKRCQALHNVRFNGNAMFH